MSCWYQAINNKNPPLNVGQPDFSPRSYFFEISALESLLRGLIFLKIFRLRRGLIFSKFPAFGGVLFFFNPGFSQGGRSKFFGAPAAREIKVFPLTTVLKVQKCRACSPQIKAFPLYDSVRRRIFSRAYGAQKSIYFPFTTALEI